MKPSFALCCSLLLILGAACAGPVASSNTEAPPSEANRAAPQRAAIVCIDPGHPSETSAGNVRQHGTTEVHIAWVVALRLQEILRSRGIDVVMTKTREDELVKNHQRAEIANRAGANLMVRLHCDASSGSGFAIYYPDRQGRVQSYTGPPDDVITRSREAARALHAEMARLLGGTLKDGGVRGDSKTYIGARQGALTGSIFSRVSVVTVEMVVLSHAGDAAFIKSAEGQQRMAEAIAAGVIRFVGEPAR